MLADDPWPRRLNGSLLESVVILEPGLPVLWAYSVANAPTFRVEYSAVDRLALSTPRAVRDPAPS